MAYPIKGHGGYPFLQVGEGGPVDCAVTCAAAIQDAVDAAVEPLNEQIADLEAEIAAVPTHWREYTQRTPHAQSGAWSVVSGGVQVVHAGDVETEPNATSPYTTWRIVDPVGNPAEGFGAGPLYLQIEADPAVIDADLMLYFHHDPTPGVDGHGMMLRRRGAGTANWGRTRMSRTEAAASWTLTANNTGRATSAGSYHAHPTVNSNIRHATIVYPVLVGLPTDTNLEVAGNSAWPAEVTRARYLTLQAIGAAGTWRVRVFASAACVQPFTPVAS